MNSQEDQPTNRNEDDPLQTMIGKQLRTLYDSVLAEPIPDKFVELLAKLDEIPAPRKPADDQSDPDQR